MLKTLLIFFIGLWNITAMAEKPIILTSDNHAILRGEIDGIMVAKTMVSLSAMKTNTPILFIQSPGGSVMAGLQLIQFMKDSGKHFVCVADMAASMAFVILQACDDRYVLSNSLIMQHLASFQVGGPTANLKSQYDNVMSIIEEMEVMQAKRIGKPLDTFKKDRLSDLWLFGKQSVKYGAADAVVSVSCDTKLWGGTTKESIIVMGMFKIDLVYSTCPLARSPLSVEMNTGTSRNLTEERFAYDKVMLMWTDFAKSIDSIKNTMFK